MQPPAPPIRRLVRTRNAGRGWLEILIMLTPPKIIRMTSFVCGKLYTFRKTRAIFSRRLGKPEFRQYPSSLCAGRGVTKAACGQGFSTFSKINRADNAELVLSALEIVQHFPAE
jgi:hypothetical protein